MSSPKVPYHPYVNSCLICGKDGTEESEEVAEKHEHGQHRKELHRCSGCKQAVYCSRDCQKTDWKVHKRECFLLQDETNVAKALNGTNPIDYANVRDGRTLRSHLLLLPKDQLGSGKKRNPNGPLLFVITELKNFLELSIPHWKDLVGQENHPALIRGRMDHLLELVRNIDTNQINWLILSSTLFGTCMIINVVNRLGQDPDQPERLFEQNAWFQAFVYNHGEFMDRVKLYAILQQHNYSHLLPDHQFPLLQMKEPKMTGGHFFFPQVHVQVSNKNNNNNNCCIICKKRMESGMEAISSHDPEKTKGPSQKDVPRETNYFPPRPLKHFLAHNLSDCREELDLKLKTWLHFVSRVRTLPKEFVCGEDCEQHLLYGRLFDSHPLEKSKKENCSSEDENDEN